MLTLKNRKSCSVNSTSNIHQMQHEDKGHMKKHETQTLVYVPTFLRNKTQILCSSSFPNNKAVQLRNHHHNIQS